MARSLITSITRPVVSLVAPVVKPLVRAAKHPLAPLGFAVAGPVVEDVAKRTGLVSWLSNTAVRGVDEATNGLKAVAGFLDFDDEPEVKNEKKDVKKTDVAGTPNAYETLHVGCAADKACGPCSKKKLLKQIAGSLEKASEAEVAAYEKALEQVSVAGKPLIPRTHAPTSNATTPAEIATQASASAASYQAQIQALELQLQAAKDATAAQKLQDQIAALNTQLAQAQTLATQAAQGGTLSNLLTQLTQLKSIESLLQPAPATAVQEVDAYGYPATPPWGSYQDQDGGTFQDPNGNVYGDQAIDPSALDQAYVPFGDDSAFNAWANYSVEGVENESVDENSYALLDENGDCLPCKTF